MDNLFLFLNTLIKRVVLGEFVMWLIFLFVGLAFIPAEWALFLNARTPAFFPDWLSLSHLGVVVFSFVSLMVYYGVVSAIKRLFEAIRNYRENQRYHSHVEQLRVVMKALSESERSAVKLIIRNQFSPTLIPFPHETYLLEKKGVIINVAKIGYPAIWCLSQAAYACLSDDLVEVEPTFV